MSATIYAVLLSLLGVVSASSVTPVEKVLELLHGMLEKAKSAKHEEVVQWTAYKRWCSDSEFDKQNLVKSADLMIESLKADVEKFDLEVQRLGQEVKGHQDDIVNFKGDLKKATEQRAIERKTYGITHQDYTESVHALKEATKAMKEQAYDRPQAVALLQRVRDSHAGLPSAARRSIEAFLSEASEHAEVAFISEPGEAHAYEFQSGSVVDLLQDLLGKFQGELRNLEKEEMKTQQAYEVLAQDLTAQTAAAEHEIDKKSQDQGENKQASADATARLVTVTNMRGDDAQFLQDLKTTCVQKSDDFEDRQKLRGEEVEALDKAITILSGDSVAGAAKEHLPSLAQRAPAASFLQLRGAPTRRSPADARALSTKARSASAAAFLQREGARLRSRVLTTIAGRMQEDPDVFVKVKKMIQELIHRLKDDAANEASHKAWCDKELSTNKETRTTKTQEVANLHATIEQLTSRVAILKREIAELSKAIADLNAQMAEALKLRSEEKAQNEDTIADAVGAQLSVGQALQLLKDYYGKAAASTVLAQEHQAPTPEIFDEPFTGQQSDSGNVIGFLEVIQSDFARLETEAKDAEQKAQLAYEGTLEDAQADKKAKETDVTTKRTDLTTKEDDLQTNSNNLLLTQEELDSALAYYEKLRPSCVFASTDGSHKERIQRREEEVAALKEALAILNGQTIVGGPDSVYSSVDGGNRGWDVGIQADTAAKPESE